MTGHGPGLPPGARIVSSVATLAIEAGYGGSAAARNRFAIAVARAAVATIGADRVAIRVAPYGAFNEMGAPAVPASFKAALRQAFGRPALANPVLVERLQHNVTLNPPDFATFYTPGEKGYTDYPVAAVAV